MSEIVPQDRRARKSTRALWESLLALMQSHDWAEITVQMIADRADVARSTFYAHFQTKQDLLDAGFALLGGALREQVLAVAAKPGHLTTLDWLVAHVSDSREFLRRVKGSVAGQVIQGRFRHTVGNLLVEELARHGRNPDARSIVFVTGGVFAVIEDWIAKGCPGDPDSLAVDLASRVMGQTPS